MGRYLRGTARFEYKHVFAEQAADLADLAGVSAVGRAIVVPSLLASFADEADPPVAIGAIALLQDLAAHGRAHGAETRGVLASGARYVDMSARGRYSTEFVQYALGENLVDVVAHLDRELGIAPERIELAGTAGYALARDEWVPLLAWINRYLPAPRALELADLAGDLRPSLDALGAAEGYLAQTALCVLAHAVAQDLAQMDVWETDAGITSDDFWGVAMESAPREVFDEAAPAARDVLLARVVAHLYWHPADLAYKPNAAELHREHRDAAERALHALQRTGDARAAKYAAKLARDDASDRAAARRATAEALRTRRGVVSADEVAAVLGRVDWATYTDRTRSRVALMQEYLRRSALWSEALGCPDRWPFFDVAGALDPQSPAPEPRALTPAVSPRVAATHRWMLRWGGALEQRPAELPDPYAPLLMFYKLGGGFAFEQRMVDVDGAGVSVDDRAAYLQRGVPFVDVDANVLRALDALRGPAAAPAGSGALHGWAALCDPRHRFAELYSAVLDDSVSALERDANASVEFDRYLAATAVLRGPAACQRACAVLAAQYAPWFRDADARAVGQQPHWSLARLTVAAVGDACGVPVAPPECAPDVLLEALVHDATTTPWHEHNLATLALLTAGTPAGRACAALLSAAPVAFSAESAASTDPIACVLALVAALDAGASFEAVTPTWTAFVAMFPAAYAAGRLDWDHLVLAARVVFSRIGRMPSADVAAWLHDQVVALAPAVAHAPEPPVPEAAEPPVEAAPAPTSVLTIAPGPLEGAHRLTVDIAAPSTHWAAAAQHLAHDLEDAKMVAGWTPDARLDLVGWAATPTSGRFYLAGSVAYWLALETAGVALPALSHLALALEQRVVHAQLDRRAITPATYAQLVGRDWPFGIEGPAVARRVEIVATDASEAALHGLCAMLRPALRGDRWERGVLPDDARATLEGRAVVLPHPGLRAGAMLAAVHAWAQLYWVDLQSVRWSA